MKVAVDVTPIRITGEIGGAFQVIEELIKGLAQSHNEDHFLLLTAEWNHDYFKRYESYGVELACVTSSKPSVHVNPVFKRVLRKVLRLLSINRGTLIKKRRLSLLKSKGVDALFCPMSAVNYKEAGIPVVSLIHDLQHEFYPQFFGEEELAHRRAFYQAISELADYLVCVSEYTRQTVVDKMNYPPDKAHVIHNSIQDRVKHSPDSNKEDILARFGVSDKLYGFYPANFWNHKNHRMLLTAFSMFKKKYPHLNLSLCLSGSLLGKEREFENIVKQMGLEKDVYHLGYVTDEEVSALMSGSEFLIFPSLFEGFGIPLAEAMALGTPVICSQTTSLPEVAGEAALYFDPRKPEEMVDAIYRVVTDPQCRSTMVAEGLQQVKKFNRDTMVKQYYDLLKKAATQRITKGNFIKGIYADNWTEKEVSIFIDSVTTPTKLIIEFLLPPVMKKANKVSMVINGEQQNHMIPLEKKMILERDLPVQQSVEVSLTFRFTFHPSDAGISDERELAVQIHKVHIVDSRSNRLIRSLHG